MPGMIDNEDRKPANPRPVFPNQYDRVHDIYGTGALICWLLTAYTAWIQILLSDPGADTIKRDLLITLSYPIAVAGHLILQMRDYPGERKNIWTTNNEEEVEFAAAISASSFVCLMALGINMVLWLSIRDVPHPRVVQRKRLGVLGLSSLWIFAGLCSTGFGASFGLWFVGAICIGATALLFYVIPFFFDTTFYLLVKFVYIFVASLVYFVDATIEDLMARVCWMLVTLGAVAILVGVCFLLPFTFYILFFPASGPKHGITDLGQAMAAIGGGINAVYALFAVAKRYGRDRIETFRSDLADSLGYEFAEPIQTRAWRRVPRGW